MIFILVLLSMQSAMAASSAELQIFAPSMLISKEEAPISLEPMLSSPSQACFKGDYPGIKKLLAQMAYIYQQSNGDLANYTIDSQTRNKQLSHLRLIFRMKSGAEWVWDEIQKCQK